ncbi:Sec-independent protein translocase protein TatB [Helicobacter suis]|uniref:Sec-independent protein translocase protein TatB n=1 Tax=Helicobacter suis TaxID=104628 RepID=UPI0013D18C84|nr:Sec-independent protein translocase protein TatB [Helicobacter suis]
MFGMGFFELVVIAVVAIIFLGPEKFPQAMLDMARFFRAVKKALNEAKETLDKEIHIEELKQESLEYKKRFEESAKPLINLKQELEEVKELKEVQDFKSTLTSIATQNPLDSLSQEVEVDEKPKVNLEKLPTNDSHA